MTAEALKYPQFSINASKDNYFIPSPVVGLANVGAQALGPIFNSGKIKIGIEIEIERTDQLLNKYVKIYLNALQAVKDALVAIRNYDQEFQIRMVQIEVAIEAFDLSWIRYDGGMTSYLDVLELQRSKFSTQLRASETLQKRLISTINLYIAIGGGWGIQNDTISIND